MLSSKLRARTVRNKCASGLREVLRIDKLPARSARPHHRPERAPPQAASFRLHVLLSRRPHPSRPPQGNSWPQNLFCSHRSGDLPCAIGRFAPSLRPRGLRSADSPWLTPLETSVTSSPSNKEPSLRVSICALGLNPSRVGKLSSGSPSSCTLDFGELHRFILPGLASDRDYQPDVSYAETRDRTEASGFADSSSSDA
jgi:hypothetical protein